MAELKIAIIGATGVVGQELIKLLEKRNFPVESLSVFASENSVGKKILFKKKELIVENIKEISEKNYDLAFSCIKSDLAKQLLPGLTKIQTIIDLSSAFRNDANICLIIPEINSHLLDKKQKIISSPNCVASILVMGLFPLTKLAKIKRVIVSSYQAASGGGQRLLEDLLEHTKNFFEDNEKKSNYAFNLYLHPSKILPTLYNDEEQKVIDETRKILNDPDLPISITCVRVPTLRAHSLSINIEFEHPLPTEKAEEALNNFPGVTVLNKEPFITPREATNQEDVFVSRIRKDLSHPYCLDLWMCGDQLLKGASLNAIQIAEVLQKSSSFAK